MAYRLPFEVEGLDAVGSGGQGCPRKERRVNSLMLEEALSAADHVAGQLAHDDDVYAALRGFCGITG